MDIGYHSCIGKKLASHALFYMAILMNSTELLWRTFEAILHNPCTYLNHLFWDYWQANYSYRTIFNVKCSILSTALMVGRFHEKLTLLCTNFTAKMQPASVPSSFNHYTHLSCTVHNNNNSWEFINTLHVLCAFFFL